MVRTTRRERFMVQSCSGDPRSTIVSSAVRAHASESRNFHGIVHQPPTEDCKVKACANEPKPPRFTPPDPESDGVPEGEWLEESPL